MRNEAKTDYLEKLVPHLCTLEATRTELYNTQEVAKKKEQELRTRVAELQDSTFELLGSSKGMIFINIYLYCNQAHYVNPSVNCSPSVQD